MSDQIVGTMCDHGFLHVWLFERLEKDSETKEATFIYRCKICGKKRYVPVKDKWW